ncbi:nuclear transport factor 2 family protein [Pseudanabaena sp. PCC 6802]|uniref:nuclear transport factor 2 family protein n=1 Tax=Pseudanabaena sp. PCC 6802 TaxID=118173 RepID=UPI0003471A01|nr:nuclear transport factor 2 family protein [Pseudanabaena sp. PCC 6802]
MVIDRAFASKFASEWFAAWNSHDLNRILSHYAEDFELSSPFIIQVAQEPTGKLTGKQAISAYWGKCLQLMPNLQFVPVNLLIGINSITLYYQSIRGLAAETFYFDNAGKVNRSNACYAES